MASRIIGSGGYLPSNIVSNEKLSETVDTNDEWIKTRTGILQRHIASEEDSCFEMAKRASLQAIEDADIKASDIELIIACSTTQDNNFPGISNKIHEHLGLNSNVIAIDLHDACSGFVYAMHIANSLIKTNGYKKTLIVCAEKMSSLLDWKDRTTCVLFGDGAGAVILDNTNEENCGIIDSMIYSDGSMGSILYTKNSSSNESAGIIMNGREVFKHAVNKMSGSIKDIAEKNNLSINDIDYIIPHQANIRIINSIANKLNVDEKKIISTIDKHANCSSASIPLALFERNKQQKIEKGSIVVMTAFGAGARWGSILLKW